MENIGSSLSGLKAETDLIRERSIGRGFRWSGEVKEAVRNLRDGGVSASRIMRETGICIETVQSWCGEKKQKRPVKRSPFRAFQGLVSTESTKPDYWVNEC